MFTLAVCFFPGILGEMEVRKVPVSVFWGLCVCVAERSISKTVKAELPYPF